MVINQKIEGKIVLAFGLSSLSFALKHPATQKLINVKMFTKKPNVSSNHMVSAWEEHAHEWQSH